MARGIAIDGTGNAHVTGSTTSGDFPTTADAFLPATPDANFGQDAFLTKLNASGSALVYSTLLGGAAEDPGLAVAIDTLGDTYLIGSTTSADLPVFAPFQATRGGGLDAFVAKFSTGTPTPEVFSITAIEPNVGGDTGRVSVVIHGGGFVDGTTVTLAMAGQPEITGTAAAPGEAGRTLATTFDLASQVRGAWDVVVTNPGGPSLTLPGAFLIEEGRAAEVWVDIVGRNTIMTGRPQTFYILYGSRGKVDIDAPLLLLRGSSGLRMGFSLERLSEPPLVIFAAGQPGAASRLRPGSTNVLPVRVVASTTGDVTLELSILDLSGQPLDWHLAADDVPARIAPAEWASVISSARPRIGDSWDDVMATLRQATNAPGLDPLRLAGLDELLPSLIAVYGGIAGGGGRSGAQSSCPLYTPDATLPLLPVASEGPYRLDRIGFKEPNPDRVYVVVHGCCSAAAGPNGPSQREARMEDLGATLKRTIPNSDVYLPDWSRVQQPTADSTIDDPRYINEVGDSLCRMLKAEGVPFGKMTVICESYGCYIAIRVMKACHEKADLLLMGDPANPFWLPRDVDTSAIPYFNQAIQLSGNDLAGNPAKLGHVDVLLETPPGTDVLGRHQYLISHFLCKCLAHGDARWLRSELVAQQGLMRHLSENYDGSIAFRPNARDCPYDPTPIPIERSRFERFLSDVVEAPQPRKTKLVRELVLRAVRSRDPNSKAGAPGSGQGRFVSATAPIPYTIFFENEAAATAPAQEVVITDRLDPATMDLSTFSLGPIALGDRQITPPPGLRQFATDVDLRPGKNLVVRVRAGLDASGVATWYFGSIDPDTGELTEDPLGGFLPPNLNPPEGDGSVLFTVKPKAGLATGTEVRNRARIVFDLNDPIDTPEWLNTLDDSKPTSDVLPLAATQTSNYFTVEWSGADVGAGILDYTIFVSEGAGPFAPWLSNTTATSALFTGEAGKSYAFYSVARDATGNAEDPPATTDASTHVASGVLDLAVTRVTAPATVNLTRGPVTRRLAVDIQNRSAARVTIPDTTTLAALVQLVVHSLGACPSPDPVLKAGGIKFPVSIGSRKKLTVPFDVTFDCANDPADSTAKNPGHEDYEVSARVDTGALGSPDVHVDDDVCPRGPLVAPDPFPDGTIVDRGCGKRFPGGELGAPILIDAVSK